MTRFGDMQFGTKFRVITSSGDEYALVLIKMPHPPNKPNEFNAFNPISGKRYWIDPEYSYLLENEPSAEETVDETSLEYILGQFSLKRKIATAADDEKDAAATALYAKLAADGQAWENAIDAAQSLNLYMNPEKNNRLAFRQLLQHLKERSTLDQIPTSNSDENEKALEAGLDIEVAGVS